ncbi:MAG: ferredoxin--NADP reductase [Rhabdaerophilum sp.]
MSALHHETVTAVHHWTDTLFSFRTTRNSAFRFRNGQFVMVGLEQDNKPLLRAYSVASANYEEQLEFFSIKVASGPLTSRLQHIEPGQSILIGQKATGTLVLDHLLPGRSLYLIGTGTGLAPFLSIIRDPETYERYERVVLLHGVRQVAELAYSEQIQREFPDHELVGEQIRKQLLYYPTVTREPFRNRGRITTLTERGQLFRDLRLPEWQAEQDRIMICGSPALLSDMVQQIEARGFAEGNSARPGSYVIERAFVEK